MARTQSINDADLIGRLSLVFRREGFAGASLAALAEAAGLKKASLYHRFPRGKEQMAEEVLASAVGWYRNNILEPLAAEGSPRARLTKAAEKLDAFYAGGRQSCLLNMLASAQQDDSPFSDGIRGAFAALTSTFASVAQEAGVAHAEARTRAERVVMLLHGSLVMARGIGDGAPFRSFLATFADQLIGPLQPQDQETWR